MNQRQTQNLAVIVGRFQTPFLHEGYRNILDYVNKNYDNCVIFIGCSEFKNKRNILPFEIVKIMIEKNCDIDILKKIHFKKINDVVENNEKWNKNLDDSVINFIDKFNGNNPNKYIDIQMTKLIGSRDSFLETYNGKFKTEKLKPCSNFNSTEIRNSIEFEYSKHFITGYNYASENFNLKNMIFYDDDNNLNFTLSDSDLIDKINTDWIKGYIHWSFKYIDKLNSSKPNLILHTDSYKLTHHKMYDSNLKYIFSYLEARKGAKYDKTVFFGLEFLLRKLEGTVITKKHIKEAEEIVNKHMNQTINKNVFNKEMWDYIVDNLDGRLPLEIYAVPEGSVIPVDNVLLTIKNTDSKCACLTNYIESYLMHIWYPCTVATVSKNCKNILTKYLEQTSDNMNCLDYMLHDFGYRGVSSDESAEIGALSHLVNFKGTDTLLALVLGREYYNCDMAGFSVNATEHSIMTSMGKTNEYLVIDRLIENYPNGILSMVLDSYDIYKAVDYLGTVVKDKILNRDGKIVVRPDSGDPVKISIDILNKLGNYFGTTLNNKGYKILNSKVGLIYGDGIVVETIELICNKMIENNWCVSNIVFGMGGGLLQKCNRDTQRFAFKSSSMMIGNEWCDIYKDPITTHSNETKKSKTGHLALIKEQINHNYKTISIDPNLYSNYIDNELKLVFKNGNIIKHYTLEDARLNSNL